MHHSRLLLLLKILRADELLKFRKYLASPYFNERPKALELFVILEKYHPDFTSNKLVKEKVWARLFPDEEYKDIKLRQLMSYTAGMAEDFLCQQRYEKLHTRKTTDLLQVLYERESDLFELDWAAHERGMDVPKGTEASEYLQRYDAISTYNAHAEQVAQRQGRKLEVKLDEAARELDHVYVIEKLKLFGEMLNYRRILDDQSEILLMDEILQHITTTDYSHVPAIPIYHCIIRSIQEPGEDKHFVELKGWLAKHGASFQPSEARRLYGMAQNYCIRRINAGQEEYLRELLSIYQQLLATGLILEKGQLSPWDFKNITSVALRLNETKWTEQFINKYIAYITEEHRDNALSYNMAKYHFQLKQYPKVLRMLQLVAYTDIFYNLDSRVTLLKTYYELDERDALLAFLDTFKTFLQRQRQVSKYHKEAYGLLIRYVKKLVSLPSGDRQRLQKFKNDMELENQLPDKTWLREKVRELL